MHISALCRLCAQNVASCRRNTVKSTQASTQRGKSTRPNHGAGVSGTSRRRSSAITAPSVKNVRPFQSFQLVADVPTTQSTANGSGVSQRKMRAGQYSSGASTKHTISVWRNQSGYATGWKKSLSAT